MTKKIAESKNNKDGKSKKDKKIEDKIISKRSYRPNTDKDNTDGAVPPKGGPGNYKY